MKVGRIKIDSVYMFADVINTTVEELGSEAMLDERLAELKTENKRLKMGTFYGDFHVEGTKLSYNTFEIVPVNEDVDKAYIESKNMTELKKKFKSQFGGKKAVRLVTFNNGEMRSVSKKTSTAKVLLVEEYEQGELEEEVVSDSILSDKMSNIELAKYNLLPDARFIYHKDYYATDYESSTTLYTVKVYRVLERATNLEDLDKKVGRIQNEYMAREKYGIRDNSRIKVIRIPSLKEHPVFYKEDKSYLGTSDILERYEARVEDIPLMMSLIDDQYTNLRPKLEDEESMKEVSTKKTESEEQESKREKVLRFKRILKSEVTILDNLKQKDRRNLDAHREYEFQKLRVKDVLHSLLITLMWRYPKSKEVNYSIVRHLAGLIKKRDDVINDLSTEYIDGLIKYVEELELKGYPLEPTKFHMF